MSHNIIDPDLHFIIDANTRSITTENGAKLTVMQYDHNSERATFELPRYIEGHDMLKCDFITVLFANTSKGTSASNRNTSFGVYQIVDIATKPDDVDTLVCTWLIAREATQYVGTLKFQLQFVCHEDATYNIPEYYWHTDQCDLIEIKPSLNSKDEVAEAYPDILTTMDDRLSALEKYGESGSSKLSVRVDEIELQVKDNENNIGKLEIKADQITQKVADANGNISTLEQTALGITQRVNDMVGDVSTLKQTATEISTRVADIGGNVSTVQQTAKELSTRITNAEGDVSSLRQTATELSSRITDTNSNVSSLRQSVEEIKAGVGGSDGNSSELAIRVDEITTRVENNEGELSTLRQTADSLTSRISSTESGISELEGDVVENAAKYSQIKQTVDNISLEVSEPIDGGTNRYVTITLTVGGNTTRGVVMIDGSVDVSGQLSAEALYAALGDIARLKVDSVSTSRRIPMFLALDENDDNYIDIENQHIALRRAWTDGSYEEARDDFGAKLYWEQDIYGDHDPLEGPVAEIMSDGYPKVNGQRVFITTENTGYPVYVYSYQTGNRLLLTYESDGTNYGPRMRWGDGYGNANPEQGRAYIQKLGATLDIYYHGKDNVKRGIFIGDEYTDIVGERRLSKAVASGNNLTLTFEGDVTKELKFGTNASGKVTSVTCEGFTTVLEGF